jgi:hypothetical protein
VAHGDQPPVQLSADRTGFTLLVAAGARRPFIEACQLDEHPPVECAIEFRADVILQRPAGQDERQPAATQPQQPTRQTFDHSTTCSGAAVP